MAERRRVAVGFGLYVALDSLTGRPRPVPPLLAQDDAGKTQVARGAVLHVGRRTVRAASGSACVGRHTGLVRATLKGAVRSNALR